MARPRGRSIAKWVGVGFLVAATAAGLVLWRWPSSTYVLLPDNAHPAADVVQVKGAKPDHDSGGIYYLDVIVSVDGLRVETPDQARTALRKRKPGTKVALGVRNDKELRTVVLKTIADPQEPSRPIVGVLLEQAAQIKLPFQVSIDTGNGGGPSAGLAFALEVMEKLGHDVDHGYKVAATGEIFLDGAVGPIGGARQKIYGARRSGVDIMLVPAGDNAKVAKRYAGHVRVIPVESFRQALHALAILPPKR